MKILNLFCSVLHDTFDSVLVQLQIDFFELSNFEMTVDRFRRFLRVRR
jgi:hypothetical protein